MTRRALGLGDPIAVSSKHGRGVGELLDRIVDLLPDAPRAGSDDGEDREEPRFAIVGRPNVGKSSLFNTLVGEERSVVFEEAGTTRDSVDALVDWRDAGRIRFVDTAGMRRAIRVQDLFDAQRFADKLRELLDAGAHGEDEDVEGEEPGDRISLGTEDRTVAYDVTYRYDGRSETIRLQEDPGDRLPVIDGEVMARVATAGGPDRALAGQSLQ